MSTSHRLTIHAPQGLHQVALGPDAISADLAEVLRHAGLPLNTRCGRQGLCSGCQIELLGGELTAIDDGSSTTVDAGPIVVKACCHRAGHDGDVELRIPARSLLAHEPQIVASFRCNVTHALEPLWQRVRIPAELADPSRPSDLSRYVAQQCSKSLPVCAADDLAHHDTATTAAAWAVEYRGDHWRLRRLPGWSDAPPYGIAVDVGTTTVVALLVDLDTGAVIATASDLNAQTYLGDNVLTRINLCLNDKSSIRELQEAIVSKTLAPLLQQLLSEAGAAAEQVVVLCAAGNTTMLHLLAGVDPSTMGMAPFTPLFLEHRMVPVGELPSIVATDGPAPQAASAAPAAALPCRLGRAFDVDPTAHLLPGAAAYVGADITAGVFSSGMAYRSGPCLLVDIGTNGEIVLKRGDRMVGCATAAGPAFEGAGMGSGVRAGKGAIAHVRLVGDPPRPEVDIIGDGPPIGLCGTGYVDFIAQARGLGLIGHTGRMTEAGTQCDFRQTLTHGRGFRIAEALGHEPILITEADIASLLQAKAAIAAGIECLLRRCEITAAEVQTVFLAGGFGFHMDLDNLLHCGILPGFAREQIEVVGNTSLAGAIWRCWMRVPWRRSNGSAQIEIIELNLEPGFRDCYVDNLLLP